MRILPCVLVVCTFGGCANPNANAPSPTVRMPAIYSAGDVLPPTPGRGANDMSGATGTLIVTVRSRVTEAVIPGTRISIDHNDWVYETNDRGLVHIKVYVDQPVQMRLEAPGHAVLTMTHPPIGQGDGSPTCGPACGGAWPGPKVETVFYLSPVGKAVQ